MPGLVLLLAPAAPLLLGGLLAAWPPGGMAFAGRIPALGGLVSIAILALLFVFPSGVREAGAGQLSTGIPIVFRLDPVSTFFALLVVVPLTLVLALRRVRRRDAAVAAIAASGSILGMEAGGLGLATLLWGAAATVLLLSPRPQVNALGVRLWAVVNAGAIALLLAVAAMQVRAGTSDFAATPVSALTVPVFITIAVAALWFSGVVPLRSWLHDVQAQAGPVTAALFAAVLVPIGLYLLVRTYEVGDGRWPHPALNVAVVTVALAAAGAAAYRAQRAPTAADFALECVPFASALTAAAVAVDTPAGVVAAVAAASTLAVAVPLVPGLAYGRAPVRALALAVVAGLPPGLVFGGRLLPIQAALESGEAGAFAAIAFVLANLVLVAAAARALRLPSGGGTQRRDRALPLLSLSTLGILAGGFLGALISEFGLPVASTVMRFNTQPVGGGTFSVVTDSGAWPAFAVLVATVAFALVVLAADRGGVREVRRRSTEMLPFFELPGAEFIQGVRAKLKIEPAARPEQELRVPEALTVTPLLFTVVLFGLLLFVVTRWAS